MLQLKNEEPYQSDAVTAWQVRTEILDQKLQGQSGKFELDYFECNPQLPVKPLGEVFVQNATITVDMLYQKLLTLTHAKTSQTVVVEIALTIGKEHWLLNGEVKDVYPEGMIVCVNSKMRGKYVMRAWIQWLALCAQGHTLPLIVLAERSDESWQGKKESLKQLHFSSITSEQAKSILRTLIGCYQDGCERPLWFDPAVFFCSFFNESQQESAAKEVLVTIDNYQPYLKALAPQRGQNEVWCNRVLEDSLFVAKAVKEAQ